MKEFGCLAVYRRMWKEPGLKRYIVHNMQTNRTLEEFTRYAQAVRWAKANRKG